MPVPVVTHDMPPEQEKGRPFSPFEKEAQVAARCKGLMVEIWYFGGCWAELKQVKPVLA